MTESINYMIGFHCGPTLMGFKVSNLVCIPSECNQAWEELLASYNEQFNKKDLFFFEVCRCRRRRMLLVYRKSQLESYLWDRKNMAFLMGQGYTPQMTLEQLLGRLRDRMEESLNFPHEIGLFLGYPLADVAYFMFTGGENYKICAEWKAYTNVKQAEYTFYRFELCRQYCHGQLLNGHSFSSLVA